MNNREDLLYKRITGKNLSLIFGLGAMMGALCFIIIYGLKPLNVCDDSWLLSGGDLSQHYFGWCFYRNSSWQYPIGMIDGLMYPDKLCITYTDSIPLFAIFFKVLSPILPKTFQYFGLWGIFCYMMMGGLASILVRKVTDRWYVCTVCSIPFIVSPYMLLRMFRHTSLAGQWIIVAAIVIIVYKPFFRNFKRQLIAWAVLMFVAAYTHIYFVPMVVIFMVGFCLEDILSNVACIGKKILKNLCLIMGACVPALIGLKILGSFEDSGPMAAEGLGEYSANLNVLWNSQGKTVGKLLPVFKYLKSQYEGLGYLGAGILIMLICLIIYKVLVIIRKERQSKLQNKKNSNWIEQHSLVMAMIVVVAISFIFALSPKITWGDKVLFTVAYPDWVLKVWSIFRATGRFIWCADYLLIAVAIMGIVQIKKKNIGIWLALICSFIQMYDLSPFVKKNHTWFESLMPIQVTMQSEQWAEWGNMYKHIVFLPYNLCDAHPEWMYAFADYAKDYNITLNYFASARMDLSRLNENQEQIFTDLKNKNGRDDTLYVFADEASAKDSGLNVCHVDGFIIGITSE